MGTRRIARTVGALTVLGSVLVPGSAVLGTAHSASASDQPAGQTAQHPMAGRVQNHSALDDFLGAGPYLAFALLCIGAGIAGGRRVWALDDFDDFDDLDNRSGRNDLDLRGA